LEVEVSYYGVPEETRNLLHSLEVGLTVKQWKEVATLLNNHPWDDTGFPPREELEPIVLRYLKENNLDNDDLLWQRAREGGGLSCSPVDHIIAEWTQYCQAHLHMLEDEYVRKEYKRVTGQSLGDL
jgi:hypothetical protein